MDNFNFIMKYLCLVLIVLLINIHFGCYSIGRIGSGASGRSSKKKVSHKGVICKTTLDSKGNVKKRDFYQDGKWVAKKIFDNQGNSTIGGIIRDGIVREYYKDLDVLKWEANYKDGLREGIYKEYYLNGQIEKEAVYRNDKCNGRIKKYNLKGILIREAAFKDNRLEGIYKVFNDDGKLIKHATYKDDKLEGIVKDYYDNGDLRAEGYYKDGKLNGIVLEYDRKGNLIAEGFFKDDKLHGKYKQYEVNGNIREESNFKDGELHGISRQYYSRCSGGIKYIDTYNEGKLIKRRHYDRRGKLEFEQDYPAEE